MIPLPNNPNVFLGGSKLHTTRFVKIALAVKDAKIQAILTHNPRLRTKGNCIKSKQTSNTGD